MGHVAVISNICCICCKLLSGFTRFEMRTICAISPPTKSCGLAHMHLGLSLIIVPEVEALGATRIRIGIALHHLLNVIEGKTRPTIG
jgi:hypothetical protein